MRIVGARTVATDSFNININSWSPAWAGDVEYYPTGIFNSVGSNFWVPEVFPGPGDYSTASSSTWVGIDGIGGPPDVGQAGTKQKVTTVQGAGFYSYYAWMELWPNKEQALPNFNVNYGDEMWVDVNICDPTNGYELVSDLSNPNAAICPYVYDYTSGSSWGPQQGYITIQGNVAPGSFVGQTAEWITERPVNSDGTYTNLANFDLVMFTSPEACDSSPSCGAPWAYYTDNTVQLCGDYPKSCNDPLASACLCGNDGTCAIDQNICVGWDNWN